MSAVEVYAVGIVHVSVCAPNDMGPQDVAHAADRTSPTGLAHGWQVSAIPTFQGGEPNPCPCTQRPGHRHWLLGC